MEWRVTQLTAEIATGDVIRANWSLTHTEGVYVGYVYGEVPIPSAPTALQYSTVTEAQAVAAVQGVLGQELVDAYEATVLAQVAAQQNPTTISGVPWAPPPAPLPPAPPPAP